MSGTTSSGRTRRARLGPAGLLVTGALAAASTAPALGPAPASAATPEPERPTSVVQLGDSIASGEGTLYGFTFDTKTGWWNGPADPKPKWSGTYQDCHQSPDAYGQVLASELKVTRFTQLGCTGATFAKGIAGPWSATVPAEFGNPSEPATLNPEYTTAKPNLVLVTLGADDVQFVPIVTACFKSDFDYRKTQCTADQPDGPNDIIKNDFTNYLPTLERNLQTLLGWIENRGKELGVVPKIVFTTYPNPLPDNEPAGGKNYCPDTWIFYNDQVNYLSSLIGVLDAHIQHAIESYANEHHDTNVAVVNLEHAFDHRRYCDRLLGTKTYAPPLAYGAGIYPHYTSLNNPNPAAFHPTPHGQQVIAAQVRPTVDRLFGQHRS